MRRLIKKNGLTVIEFLVVIAILAILVTFSLVMVRSFQKEKILDTTTEEMVSTLRLAQSKTLASEGASSFGVYFEADKFILFKGIVFDSTSSDNEVHQLPSELTISEINLLVGPAVVFERLTGFTANSGFIKIEVVGDNTKNRTIFIDFSGTVSLASSGVDDSGRLKDSRHVHILYSQNTKNSLTLSLVFPNDGQTENIDYQSYLDAGKTQFNWEGILNIGGVNQELEIHSHQLIDAATLFCIHRDRRLNSKALNIFLDGENLINYTANGTTIQGTSFWAGPPTVQ